MTSPRSLVVLGGGVIGLATAFHAARRGLRVTLLERLGPDRDGCSFGNAGMVCPSHFVPLAAPGAVVQAIRWMANPKSPFYLKPRLDLDLLAWACRFWRSANAAHVRRAAPLLRDLALASREDFASIASLPGSDFGLVRQGLLMLCRTRHALDDESRLAEQARRLGLEAEVLTPGGVAALEPDLTLDIVGGVHFPQDCHLVPDRFLAALHHHAVQAGAQFVWNSEVTGWRTEGGRIVAARTAQDEWPADTFVLCGGSWSPRLAQPLGLRLPIQAGKGYSLTLPHPRQLPRHCAILTEARIAVTPMSGALRFGGTMEIAGLDESINPLRVQGILDAIPNYLPAFQPQDFHGIPPWRGLRPVSPDGLPYLGRSRRWPNLIVATGHAMLGLSLAPVTGQIVARLATGEPPGFDLTPVDPDRFA
ncbi:MAG: FAD-dependent oxidoreductase [Verrucomicrobiae bacterium]|nr:FAD-dependent oxidoreductase [Verrucomicrobiae bacterium]